MGRNISTSFSYMKATISIVAFLCLFLNSVYGDNDSESYVKVLDANNFDDYINENMHVLVEFYAPWCGHCKQLAPIYEEAAKKLHESESSIKLAKVDAVVETQLAKKYSIAGYPTLFFFRSGVQEEYGGGRSVTGIISWLQRMTDDSVVVVPYVSLKDKVEEKLIESNVFVGLFHSDQSVLYQKFKAAADNGRQYGYYYASFNATTPETVYVKRKDEDIITMNVENEADVDISAFIEMQYLPAFGPINAENFKGYSDRGLDLVWFCGSEADYNSYKKLMTAVSNEKRSAFSFVWLDSEAYKGHVEGALGVTKFPSIVLQTDEGRYLLDDISATMEGSKVIQFLDDAVSGKIEKSLKSDPIPEENDGPVKVVVGKNFEDLVIQPDKDVLLEVYAPWCGHCKKLEPIYNEFAELVKNVDHLVVAKMDGTSNDSPLPQFQWSGFPSLFFVKAGSNTPIAVQSDRTVDALFEFVKTHSTKTIDSGDATDGEL